MVVIDTVSRYIDGVLKDDSTKEESFSEGLLEYPQYTRPEIFNGKKYQKYYFQVITKILTNGEENKV